MIEEINDASSSLYKNARPDDPVSLALNPKLHRKKALNVDRSCPKLSECSTIT